MSNFNDFYPALASSCIALNKSRFLKTKEGHVLFKEAVAAVIDMFSSLTDIQDIIEAELIYLENERTFCRPISEKSFADAITSYHYARDILKVITNEPEMYVKYCVPACLSTKTNDKSGVPKDAFRQALASHKTRLQNNDRAHGLSEEDSIILSFRLNNVSNALKSYTHLQEQTLGL